MNNFFKLCIVLFLSLLVCHQGPLFSQETTPALSTATKICVECHQGMTPGVLAQWKSSTHYKMGIGCYECHKALREEKDARKHEGYYISVIVSPKDCAGCHPQQVREFSQSKHMTAYDAVSDPVGVLVSQHVFGGMDLKSGNNSANINGCWKCHGSPVTVKQGDNGATLESPGWPNTGVGRWNPDGSKGSCSACHSGHMFSAAQARRPESCKQCHSGDSSFFEYQIYMQSRHGINYDAFKDKMNFGSKNWVAGQDYYAAPTCASCHMSAAPGLAVSHNVGSRVEANSKNMIQVCQACHIGSFLDNWYPQVISQKALLQAKWLTPAKALYCLAVKLIIKREGDKYRTFNNPIDYTYLFINQYSKVAKWAAFMMSPQYVEDNNKAIAALWFGKFVPQLRALIAECVKKKGTKVLALELKKQLDCWLSHPTYGPCWPKTPLEDCTKTTLCPPPAVCPPIKKK